MEEGLGEGGARGSEREGRGSTGEERDEEEFDFKQQLGGEGG